MNTRVKVLIRAAIHIPKLQEVSGHRRPNPDVQFSSLHPEIPLNNFWAINLGMNPHYQINLSIPFRIAFSLFVWKNISVWYRRGGLDPRNHEIAKLPGLSIICTDVPA